MDTESFINYNDAVDVRERVYRKFPKDYCERHHMRILVQKWTPYVKYLRLHGGGTEHRKKMYTLLYDMSIPVNAVLFKYNKKMYDTAIRKGDEFMNENNEDYLYMNDDERAILLDISKKMRKNVGSNPFVRSISLN
jgi:hypothetical protein